MEHGAVWRRGLQRPLLLRGSGQRCTASRVLPTQHCAPLRCFQVYVYLNEGERLLKTLKKENSCSQTFESATLYSFKGQVRTR